MGRNARLRKLRREARKQFGFDPAKAALVKAHEKKHPGSIVFGAGAAERMSEVLEDFAEPLLSVADSPEDTRRALVVAMAAWNYALLREAADAEPDLDSTLLSDPGARRVFEFLVARKQELYPDNKRAILDYQLIPNGTEYQFNVISSLG
jgi:hypothetical protein